MARSENIGAIDGVMLLYQHYCGDGGLGLQTWSIRRNIYMLFICSAS